MTKTLLLLTFYINSTVFAGSIHCVSNSSMSDNFLYKIPDSTRSDTIGGSLGSSIEGSNRNIDPAKIQNYVNCTHNNSDFYIGIVSSHDVSALESILVNGREIKVTDISKYFPDAKNVNTLDGIINWLKATGPEDSDTEYDLINLGKFKSQFRLTGTLIINGFDAKEVNLYSYDSGYSKVTPTNQISARLVYEKLLMNKQKYKCTYGALVGWGDSLTAVYNNKLLGTPPTPACIVQFTYANDAGLKQNIRLYACLKEKGECPTCSECLDQDDRLQTYLKEDSECFKNYKTLDDFEKCFSLTTKGQQSGSQNKTNAHIGN